MPVDGGTGPVGSPHFEVQGSPSTCEDAYWRAGVWTGRTGRTGCTAGRWPSPSPGPPTPVSTPASGCRLAAAQRSPDIAARTYVDDRAGDAPSAVRSIDGS